MLDNTVYIEQVESLLGHLKSGNNDEADAILRVLTKGRESELFSEIGKLTRELHDALHNFKLDSRMADLAAQDIPDAKDRLEYVLKMTNDAANKTMDAADSSSEVCNTISAKAQHLQVVWDKVNKNEITGKEFKSFFVDLGDFLQQITSGTTNVSESMTEIVMAQGFQDLTGQVIQRIISLVQDVEESLVHTIKMFGQMNDYQQAVDNDKNPEKGVEGPAIDADNREDVVANQDEVDDLLSSLGF